MLLVEDDGRTLAARAAKGLEEEVERGFRLPVGRGFAGRAGALVLDLTETSYIDSSGIGLIFDTAARMRNRRQELRLVVEPSSFVGEVLAAV